MFSPLGNRWGEGSIHLCRNASAFAQTDPDTRARAYTCSHMMSLWGVFGMEKRGSPTLHV